VTGLVAGYCSTPSNYPPYPKVARNIYEKGLTFPIFINRED